MRFASSDGVGRSGVRRSVDFASVRFSGRGLTLVFCFFGLPRSVIRFAPVLRQARVNPGWIDPSGTTYSWLPRRGHKSIRRHLESSSTSAQGRVGAGGSRISELATGAVKAASDDAGATDSELASALGSCLGDTAASRFQADTVGVSNSGAGSVGRRALEPQPDAATQSAPMKSRWMVGVTTRRKLLYAARGPLSVSSGWFV